jgi:zinc protease
VDRPGTVQTSLWVGVHAPRYAEPGHDDRQVLSNLFGGLFTSRLNLNLREKHAYTYGASSAAVATNRFGAFVVSTSVETKTTSAALSEIFAELSKLKQPGTLTQEELTRSVTDLVFNVAAQLDHTDQLLESATAQFVHQLPLDRFSRYAETLRNVTEATAFRETARIPDQGFTIVVVGDRSVIGSLGRFAAQEEAVDLAWLE